MRYKHAISGRAEAALLPKLASERTPRASRRWVNPLQVLAGAVGAATTDIRAIDALRKTPGADNARKWDTTLRFVAPRPGRRQRVWTLSRATQLTHFWALLVSAQHGHNNINKVPVEMKIDTGADVTAIPETVYKQELQSAPKLSQPSRILRGPDGKTLPTVGSFRTSLTTESPSDNTTQQTVFVVRGLRMSLPGRPAIQALHILKQLDSLPASVLTGSNIVDTFPSLFTGLGEVKGPHTRSGYATMLLRIHCLRHVEFPSLWWRRFQTSSQEWKSKGSFRRLTSRQIGARVW